MTKKKIYKFHVFNGDYNSDSDHNSLLRLQLEGWEVAGESKVIGNSILCVPLRKEVIKTK